MAIHDQIDRVIKQVPGIIEWCERFERQIYNNTVRIEELEKQNQELKKELENIKSIQGLTPPAPSAKLEEAVEEKTVEKKPKRVKKEKLENDIT